MKLIFYLIAALALFSNAYAHTAFTLVSSEKKTLKPADVAENEKSRTPGTVAGSNLTYAAKEIRLVVITGPEDDMLSYRIQGVRNPNIVVPAGATLRILFVNVDSDMRHDIRFGHVTGEFPIAPEIAETAGTEKLTAKANEILQAEEIVIRANETGAFKYFCSVRGHAKGGMWGNILVGVKPGEELKTAPKTVHVHSPDEDNEPAAKPPSTPASPDKKPVTPASTHDHGSASEKKPTAPVSMYSHGTSPPASGTGTETAVTDHNGHGGAAGMRSSINIGEPMTREGSGTTWVPDSSPMYAWMKTFGDGSMLMLHGTGFLRYTSVGSDRDVSAAGKGGRSRFDAPTMLMAMYSKPLNERSQIGIRAMLSLDPIIQRGYGYPLLYQSGELFHDVPLHDRQHPHDLISELAATYSYKFDDKNSVYIYAGLPGEPALGPPMYLHRASGANMPDAPIGHHWQDASHISFGVVTAGFTHGKIKLEASAFNGTEPDENRWAFDKPRLNSFSGRLSFNPTHEWSFQISHGYLKNPERADPGLKVLRRTTASGIYNKAFGENRNWANAFVWGQNHTHDGRTNSFLFESNYEFYKNNIFGRMERVQKNAHELVLAAPHPEGDFWVGAYSFGYMREVVKDKGIDVGLGSMVTFNTNPSAIGDFYGGTRHAGWQVFVRFRPSRHR